MKDIPVKAAEKIAKDFDYDQVVIIARKVGDDGGEQVTTYGRNKVHCGIVAKIGEYIKYRIMGWKKAST